MNAPAAIADSSWLILMRLALHDVAIERRNARLQAYARANVPREVAEALDDDAHLGETLRRGRQIASVA